VEIPFQKVNLTFTDIHYTVRSSITNEDLELLKGVDGFVEAGKMTALMGSSGVSDNGVSAAHFPFCHCPAGASLMTYSSFTLRCWEDDPNGCTRSSKVNWRSNWRGLSKWSPAGSSLLPPLRWICRTGKWEHITIRPCPTRAHALL
jgi:hypothetical protein